MVDFSTTLAGAYATQFLADCGADVVMVEPAAGNPLRQQPGWPGLLRGKRSVALDLRDTGDREEVDRLLERADVAVMTVRPAIAGRYGLVAADISARHPHLVVASITGWGSRGPWRDYKGWEALVMAKVGVMHEKQGLTRRPGPAYVTTLYASWGAAHAAVQGILASLIERDCTGRGQVVESNLVTGLGAMDPWNWFHEMILDRYPDAFQPAAEPYDQDARPVGYLVFPLLAAPTKDAHWLQFAQVSPKLMHAWMSELDLLEELKKPKWQDFPMLPTPELRTEWWDMMLERVQARTLDDWQAALDANPDLSAELFRTPEASLEHPQTVFEGRAVELMDPKLGPVRQPSTLIHVDGKPVTDLRAAPLRGEHRIEELDWHESEHGLPDSANDGDFGLPLRGVTIVEMGSMYAGPYGATILTDLGARVIKIEPLDGDNIRGMLAYPEAGGAKVLQGKESCAIDITTAEGRDLVYALIKNADVVLNCSRGKSAERAKVDEDTLKSINPDLIVLSTSGYGLDGPFAHRAAYAPSIGAASGLSLLDSHGAAHAPKDLDDLHRTAAALFAGGTVLAVQCDGIAALGVASALMVGIYAKSRGVELSGMATTMLGSVQQALISHNLSYAGKGDMPDADPEFYGLNALYRLYRAADGWIFLAAPLPMEWTVFTEAMSLYCAVGADPRFATPALRVTNDAALAAELAAAFATRDKADWEKDLAARDVGCVAVAERSSGIVLQGDDCFEAGYSVESHSPVFDQHRRLAPLHHFSRSLTKADGGCTLGQHTRAIMREIGLDDEAIDRLEADRIIACG
ncbi:CoA-transferase/lyase DddD [Mycolicibacterium vanbaalenii]|uniref:CoA-transferase/lyase DddD n=1 Tax=Mycolicibacterium vanbaalenii TaxID=110539 RepID=A0A5S9RAI7_MYCVN|nr:CoA-transferase/lyase DddD [Mycolicibacterium vanbaalenii]